MTKRMLAVLIGIVAIMLFLVVPELLTGMTIFDAFLSSMGFNVSVIVDSTPPYVEIISPTPIVYHQGEIQIEYNVTDTLSPISTIWYKLDSSDIVILNGPQIIPVTEGFHTLYLYANDTAGNVNYSSTNFIIILPQQSGVYYTGGGGGTTTQNITIVNQTTILYQYQNVSAPPTEIVEVTKEVTPPESPSFLKYIPSLQFRQELVLLLIIVSIIYIFWYIKRKENKGPASQAFSARVKTK